MDYSALNRQLIATWPSAALLYPSAGGGPLTITGILSDPFMLEGQSAMSGSVVARLFLNAADLTTVPKNGDRLTINSVSYSVSGDPRADVGGGITLDLRRNA